MSGDAAICKIHITNAGANVPCLNVLFNSFTVNQNNTKISDYAYAGPICSISEY